MQIFWIFFLSSSFEKKKKARMHECKPLQGRLLFPSHATLEGELKSKNYILLSVMYMFTKCQFE